MMWVSMGSPWIPTSSEEPKVRYQRLKRSIQKYTPFQTGKEIKRVPKQQAFLLNERNSILSYCYFKTIFCSQVLLQSFPSIRPIHAAFSEDLHAYTHDYNFEGNKLILMWKSDKRGQRKLIISHVLLETSNSRCKALSRHLVTVINAMMIMSQGYRLLTYIRLTKKVC